MSKKWIIPLLLFLVAVTVVILVIDYKKVNGKEDNTNPYELTYDEFKTIPENEIGYREVLKMKIPGQKPGALLYHNKQLYLASDSSIYVISTKGELLESIPLKDNPRAIAFYGDQMVVAYLNYFSLVDKNGVSVAQSKDLGEHAVITSVKMHNNQILVADAGNRKVYAFDANAELITETGGQRNPEDKHGFIIPSPYFDMAIDPAGDLWVVNPGQHALEQYSNDLTYRANWGKASFGTSGFSGCCNPAQIAINNDGEFITSEKGLVRIKVYSPSGELKTVVAAPDKFRDEGHAPDVTVDEEGIIYALDYDTNTIRVFQKK